MIITHLKTEIDNISKEMNRLEGRLIEKKEQHLNNIYELIELKALDITNDKAIELLNLVQKATKEVIRDVFETITTKALQYIHQSNKYNFELEFGRRGNIPELDFNVKTPDLKEAHAIMDTRGGGTTDVVGLALRFVLLEISKTPGFLFLDEPFKHLDDESTMLKALEFVQEVQKNTGRQIFIITHHDPIVNAIPNAIILDESSSQVIDIVIEEKPEKKKRKPRKKKEA